MRNLQSQLKIILIISVSAWLTACGGESNSSPETVTSIDCGTGIINDTGGTNGYGYELAVNAGAVSLPTDIAFIPGSSNAFLLISQSGSVYYFNGGDELVLGETTIKILHTPGHTPGSACYQLGNEIITGDTLFVFGCGRCDMSGGNLEYMFVTLKNMKERLPQDMLIHPGHNYSVKETCTLSDQVEGDPFMHYDDAEAFVNYHMHVHDKTRDEPYNAVSK